MTAVAPTTVRRHESDAGSWSICERQPHPLLVPYVRVYEDYHTTARTSYRDHHLPFGGLPLIWTFAGRLDQVDRSTASLAPSNDFIAGLHDRFATAEASSETRGVQVNLTPIGARMLLGISMHELTNTFITLDQAPGPGWRAVGERLAAAATSETRFDLLDDFFAKSFARTSPVPEGVAWAWAQIERSSGTIAIGSLTSALGVTRKRMVSDFREHLGLPPKTVARVARFNRAMKLLGRAPGTLRWTRIAGECGYYDQAHFIREVRALSGDTPTQLLRRLLARPTPETA